MITWLSGANFGGYKMANKLHFVNIGWRSSSRKYALKINVPSWLILFGKVLWWESGEIVCQADWSGSKDSKRNTSFIPFSLIFSLSLSRSQFKRLRPNQGGGGGEKGVEGGEGRVKPGTHQTTSYRHKVCSVWPEEPPIRPSQSVKCSRASLPITDRSPITILNSERHWKGRAPVLLV